MSDELKKLFHAHLINSGNLRTDIGYNNFLAYMCDAVRIHSAHLTEAAGEDCDYAGANEACREIMLKINPHEQRDPAASYQAGFLRGQRWRWEQNRARIGLAELQAQGRIDAADVLSSDLIARAERAESRLAESERKSNERFHNLNARELQINDLKDKLSASEARCKELEAALDLAKTMAPISHKDRIAELENELLKPCEQCDG